VTPTAGANVSDLIDTTEMYLRTIFELEEEGIVPLRARIAERLGQSGPTVSQTVARMARDGLLTVEGDRHLQLSETGRTQATRVMRKHRLAECLLVDVIGLEWDEVHEEACRWEHVISETVELKLLNLLGNPTSSPYGNPIPGLEELDANLHAQEFMAGGLISLREIADTLTEGEHTVVVIRRIGEPVQTDLSVMHRLRRVGVRPGAAVELTPVGAGMLLASAGESTELDPELASHVFADAR
jgi:DtxR family transcriptional regulator, Mn-dependent transcriptional regulator